MGKGLPIKKWSTDERPREKLLRRGARSLSKAELIAILLGSGTGNISALDLARKILSHEDNDLERLSLSSARELMNRHKGIGVAKASAIVAAFELGRRRAAQTREAQILIRSSTDVYRFMGPLLSALDHEEFWAVFLNNANVVLGKELMFSGGIAATVVDIRIIFRMALEMKATSVIVVHNHPGGEFKPSNTDMVITGKIKTAGKIMDIRLRDHLIIGGTGYFSFADEGVL